MGLPTVLLFFFGHPWKVYLARSFRDLLVAVFLLICCWPIIYWITVPLVIVLWGLSELSEDTTVPCWCLIDLAFHQLRTTFCKSIRLWILRRWCVWLNPHFLQTTWMQLNCNVSRCHWSPSLGVLAHQRFA